MTPKEAKNYVAGTLEHDQPYERLLRQVVLEGELTHDRTGVGTLSTFGTRMEFNLQDGFPLVTTKKVFLRGIIAELLWFIAGDNKVSTLQKQNVHIWDEWVLPDGTIGKGYPIQWRSWPKTDGTTVDQLSNALSSTIRTAVESSYPHGTRENWTKWHYRHATPCSNSTCAETVFWIANCIRVRLTCSWAYRSTSPPTRC